MKKMKIVAEERSKLALKAFGIWEEKHIWGGECQICLSDKLLKEFLELPYITFGLSL